jgi:hypothetical protein
MHLQLVLKSGVELETAAGRNAVLAAIPFAGAARRWTARSGITAGPSRSRTMRI